MDFSSLFNYPGKKEEIKQEEFIFMSDLSADDWLKIFDLTEIYIFKKGEIVVHSGDTERVLYIVKSGFLEVFIPQKNKTTGKKINNVNEGSVFGELSFFDGRPRSASVRAITDGEIMSLSISAFEILSARDPELSRKMLLDLARILSIRIRQLTFKLIEL